jgi:hypothetical protein
MHPSPGPAGLPGVVRQLGYVVRDLDRTVADWLKLGVGPWFVLRGQLQSVLYRGRPCTVAVSLAFANSGDLQIEVIQQEDDTPSIFTEFLASGNAGVHQLTEMMFMSTSRRGLTHQLTDFVSSTGFVGLGREVLVHSLDVAL